MFKTSGEFRPASTEPSVVPHTQLNGIELAAYIDRKDIEPFDQGYLLRVQVSRENNDFALNAYPYENNDITLERIEDRIIARLGRTVESCVMVGSTFTRGDFDHVRTRVATLRDGRRMFSDNPPLRMLGVTIRTNDTIGSDTRVSSIIVERDTAKLSQSINDLTEGLRLQDPDKLAVVQSILGQVEGFWMPQSESTQSVA